MGDVATVEQLRAELVQEQEASMAQAKDLAMTVSGLRVENDALRKRISALQGKISAALAQLK